MGRLVALVYDELRRMAHRQLSNERGPCTLDTTGLVHEAYLKLIDQDTVPIRNRNYFFAAAARAMRQVLVDAARRRKRLKRGGGERPLPLDETQIVVDDYAAELVELDDALVRLAGEHPRPARVVECRFFGGLSIDETAMALEISPMTVKRDWMLARTWLYRDLKTGDRDRG
jgi:RNA polymerase sigma factor (TIGR02999 family)